MGRELLDWQELTLSPRGGTLLVRSAEIVSLSMVPILDTGEWMYLVQIRGDGKYEVTRENWEVLVCAVKISAGLIGE